MPHTLHLLGTDKKGAESLVLPTSAGFSNNRKALDAMIRTGKLPDGITKIEAYDSEQGKIKTIFPHDAGASHRAEVARIQEAKAKSAPAKPTEVKPTAGNKLTPL